MNGYTNANNDLMLSFELQQQYTSIPPRAPHTLETLARIQAPMTTPTNGRPAHLLQIALDTSYSMTEGGRLDCLKAGMRGICDTALLGSNFSFRLWEFGVECRPITPLIEKVEASEVAEIVTKVNGLECAGSFHGATNISDAVLSMANEARTWIDDSCDFIRSSTLIVITDGAPTAGIMNAHSLRARLDSVFGDRQMSLSVLAVGSSVDPYFVNQICTGLFAYASTSDTIASKIESLSPTFGAMWHSLVLHTELHRVDDAEEGTPAPALPIISDVRVGVVGLGRTIEHLIRIPIDPPSLENAMRRTVATMTLKQCSSTESHPLLTSMNKPMQTPIKLAFNHFTATPADECLELMEALLCEPQQELVQQIVQGVAVADVDGARSQLQDVINRGSGSLAGPRARSLVGPAQAALSSLEHPVAVESDEEYDAIDDDDVPVYRSLGAGGVNNSVHPKRQRSGQSTAHESALFSMDVASQMSTF